MRRGKTARSKTALFQSPYGLLPEGRFGAKTPPPSGVLNYESTYRPLFYASVSFLIEATRTVESSNPKISAKAEIVKPGEEYRIIIWRHDI